MEYFLLESGQALIHLPPGNERNEYVKVLCVTLPTGMTGPKLVVATATEPAWEFLDLEPPPEERADLPEGTAPGTVVAKLSGAFRETGAGGVHDFTLKLTGTGAQDVEYRCRVLVQSLQNVTINVSDLPPVIRTKPYHVKLTADGGRKPYTWRAINGTNLPDDLKFTPSTAVLEGTVSSPGLSQQTFTLAVQASSADGPVQQPAEKAFNLQIAEPEQLAGYITSWIELGLAMMGMFGIGSFIYDIYRDNHDKKVDMAKEMDKYLSSEDWKLRDQVVRSKMSPREFADHIRQTLAAQGDGGNINKDLTNAIKMMTAAEGEYTARAQQRVQDRAAQQAIVNDPNATAQARQDARDAINKLDADGQREAEEKRRIEDGRKELEKRKSDHTAERNAERHVVG